MKKILGLFALIVTTVILTGCGKYDTTCTMTYNESGVKYDAKVQINYSGDKVKEAVATMTMDTKEHATQMCESLSLFKESGVDVKCGDKKIVIKNYEKIDGSQTKTEIIESLEDSGFKCK